MKDLILSFAEQFKFEPVIEFGERLPQVNKFIVCGMGGSPLAGNLLKVFEPRLDLLVHRDYGLPRVPDYFLRGSLLVCISYSGNTEETLDTFNAAQEAGLNLAVIASGGKLLEAAKAARCPFVVIPSGLPPRLALGLILRALTRLCSLDRIFSALSGLSAVLDPRTLETAGRHLAGETGGRVPVIYSSVVNYPLAYIWKINFNETAKWPAFCHALPEANHNELAGFGEKELAVWQKNFVFLFLRDVTDGPGVQKRFAVLEKLYTSDALAIYNISMTGSGWTKILSNIILSEWCAFYHAFARGIDPVTTPAIEKFKRLIA